MGARDRRAFAGILRENMMERNKENVVLLV